MILANRSVCGAASSYRLLLTLLCAMVSAHAQTWVNLPGDRMYQGDLEEGLPYGFGTMVYPNGTHYQGEFVNGYREGRGTAIFYDGTRYEGEWHDDLPHGRGVIEWRLESDMKAILSITCALAAGSCGSAMERATTANGATTI